MITAIGRWVEHWEALRERPGYRGVGLLVAVGLFGGLLCLPSPEGMPIPAQQAAALLVLMAWLWIGGVLPLAVTALVPLVLVPLLGLGQMSTTAAAYFDPLNVLMLGGFILGLGMESVGLHRRFTAFLLRPDWVRSSPRRMLLALMVATALLSTLMSNTATMLMMLPLALTTAKLSTDDERVRVAFPLGCAYAASIGGVGTLIGTPSNAVFAAEAPKWLGREVSFAEWSMVGLPFVFLAIPVAWLAIVRTRSVPVSAVGRIEAPVSPPWTFAELTLFTVMSLTLLAWLTRAPVDLGFLRFPGWAKSVGPVDDAWVAIFAALALFLLPQRVERGAPPLLSWAQVERAIPWGVLLLLGGGFALASAIETSGLTTWLAGAGPSLARLPLPVATLAICAAMVVLTEFTSNTAAAQIAVPLFAAAAQGAGVAPAIWLVPCTIGVSCGFMMPAGTGPNAIATEAGGVRPGDMAYAGLLVNGACILLAAAVSLVLVPFVFR